MRMGVPPSSVNCFEGGGFLLFPLGTGAMRVPSPAAGIMTTTFMGRQVYEPHRAEFKSAAPHLRFPAPLRIRRHGVKINREKLRGAVVVKPGLTRRSNGERSGQQGGTASESEREAGQSF